MKILPFVYLIVLGGVLIHLHADFPIMKVSTDDAVSAIESQFLREDLTAKEKGNFDFYADWVKGNQDGVSKAWESATSSVFLLFVATLLWNIFNLGSFIRNGFKKGKNKAEQGGDGDAEEAV